MPIERSGASTFPPGFEISYTEITANVNVLSTTEATGTTIIAPAAITFDGGAVLCHCEGLITTPTAVSVQDFVVVSLFESATQVTRLGTVLLANLTTGQITNVPISQFFRFTPSAGSHTYTVTAFTNSTTGAPKVAAGAGGTGGNPPAFIRFTKV